MNTTTIVGVIAATVIPLAAWWIYTRLQAKSDADTLRVRQAAMRARRSVEVAEPPAKPTRASFGRR